ncbi:hypothetical protein JHK87_043011 [Glycine soja]|nr:hypothetical protein JHK87_043011 [Glycine soja]
MKLSTARPPCGDIGSVSFSITISGRNCCIACNNLSKSWNDHSQLLGLSSSSSESLKFMSKSLL